MQKIRQPIITTLGHVDHGKTTLLDKIRGSDVYSGEAGGITQAIGASEIPIDVVKKRCKMLLEKFGIGLDMPGILLIDTPGHEAFTTLRKRGGAISDIAILVIDINEGVMPQTSESLMFLKEFKTPFVVAASKIDRILGWRPNKDECFINTIKEQSSRVADDLETKLYNLIGQLAQNGFDCDRYDRVTDFTKQICIVPVSGVTGEGVSDLLVMLTGLAQKYLKERIKLTKGEGKGTILEVKENKGLGMAIDVILYDGEVNKGDYIIIGGKETIVSKIKAVLKSEPLKELRVEKKFESMDNVVAAAGIKVSAPGLEKAVAGSPLRFVSDKKDIEKAKTELREEIEEVEIETNTKGVILKADTLGSLEALIKIFKEMEMPLRKAVVGNVTKQDVMEVQSQDKPLIFAFNVSQSEDSKAMAKDYGVMVFSSNIIYKLVEDYEKWKKGEKELKDKEILESVTRPGRLRILPGFVFRQSKPAIFGVEVIGGTIKSGYKMKRKDKTLEEVKELQKEGKNVNELANGDRGAVSMDIIIGKHAFEGDILETDISLKDIRLLNRVKAKLREDEKQLLEEIESRE